jgi:pimeloyl-ACP methyl ester carboxylesterase
MPIAVPETCDVRPPMKLRCATPVRCARLRGRVPARLSSLFALLIMTFVFEALPLVAAAPPSDRASMQSFQIPSHGSLLNAFLYVAAGPGPHPAVVLLHGFPGNERNLDLAQDIRRAGWDVLFLDFRGSWGTPGDYSFTHSIEDTAAAVAYLRQPEVAKSLRLDPARIALLGHSMGGFLALQGGAADPTILGIGMISAADIGARIPSPLPQEHEAQVIEGMSAAYAKEGMAPLAGCTPESLARETVAHAEEFRFLSKVDAVKSRPVLIVTSDDGLAAANGALAAALEKAGDARVTTLHLDTDHAYSDERLALSAAVLKWLATLTPAGAR